MKNQLLYEVINYVTKEHTKNGIALTLIPLFSLGLYFLKSEYDSLFLEVFFWVSIFVTLFGIHYYFVLSKGHRNAILNLLKGKCDLWFEYENGDELIITDKVIIPFSLNQKKIPKKVKIEKVSWGLSNLKTLISELKEGSLPIGALIPSIKYSTNKLPPAILLAGSLFLPENIYYHFLDLAKAKILMITIIVKGQNQINLTYPIPEYISFDKNDFDEFLSSTAKKNFRAKGMYIDDERLIEIME